MPPIDTDSATNPAEAPVLLEALASIHDEASVDLTADLLETTSATALELPSVGAAEIAPTISPDVSGDEAARIDHAKSAALLAEAPAAMSDISGVDQSAVEDADQPLPVTTEPTSLRDDQLRPAEASQDRPVSHTLWLASPNFTQTVFQMNVTAWAYARSESEAALAYLQALSRARTPSQVFDLQTREMTRAINAAARFGEALAGPGRQLLTGSGLQPNAAA
ncbi:hypothetical protein ACRAWG_25805 [Methylobacterium sp. P31]